MAKGVKKYLKETEISSITLKARPGATLGSAVQEGLMLSSAEWVPVVVIHNDKSWEIKPEDLWSQAKGPDKK